MRLCQRVPSVQVQLAYTVTALPGVKPLSVMRRGSVTSALTGSTATCAAAMLMTGRTA